MTSFKKLQRRFKSFPSDFEYRELKQLLEGYGYVEREKGRTSGSRMIFEKEGCPSVLVHKPHSSGDPISKGRLKDIAAVLDVKGVSNDF